MATTKENGVILHPADQAIIHAFLLREAADFALSGEKATAYADARLAKITNALTACTDCDDLIIRSLGNTGCEVRHLTLGICKAPTPDGFPSQNVAVTLCMCGKLTCWGSVSAEKR